MPRTSSQILNFWQFETGLYDDAKMIDLNEQYGPLGEAIYFRILCYISETNGYFAKLNETLIRYVYRSLGSKWVKRQKIAEVIQYCGVCGLFDGNLLAQNVITSQGIQRRWLYAKQKSRARGFSTENFWLLQESEACSDAKNSDSCSNNADYCNNNADNCNNNSCISEEKENGIYTPIAQEPPVQTEHPERYTGKNQNLSLLLSEYEELIQKGIPKEYIDYFSDRMKKGGYWYEDHFRTILEWWHKDRTKMPWNRSQRQSYENQAEPGSSFCTDDFFRAALKKSIGE